MTDKIIVLSTCPSREDAGRLGRILVEARLAACVTLLENAGSIYRWQDNIEEATEVLIIIKTRSELFAALRERIASIHPYEVPEIIAMPVVDGSPSYLDWIDRETAHQENSKGVAP